MQGKLPIAVALLVVFFSVSCSTGNSFQARRGDRGWSAKQVDLRRLPPSDIPIVVNDKVVSWMEYFQGPGRHHFERYLARSGRYTSLMRKILAEEGVPQDLVYISMIESGFNPYARSRANAVGAWQFIRATGRRYGLPSNEWVDERRDVVKATHGAARYFKDLYAEFGDWYLAMAAYNAGEGRVRKAVAAAGSKDFWKIAEPRRRLLRPETRDYVPKYLAAAILSRSPEKFGFQVPKQLPLEFDTVTVGGQTDITVLAECAATTATEIEELNPQLIRFVTPPTQSMYEVKIPKGKASKFQVAYAALPAEKRTQVAYHRVHRGETLVRIARRYHVPVALLASANGLGAKQKVRTGTRLMIPKSTATQLADDRPRSRKNGNARTHTLARGETVGAVAARYGVKQSDLMAWNQIQDPRRVQAGKKLIVREPGTTPVKMGSSIPGVAVAMASTQPPSVSPSPAASSPPPSSPPSTEKLSYRVRRGDTLWEIAKRHGVTIAELKEWNALSNPRAVRAGDHLTINVSRQ